MLMSKLFLGPTMPHSCDDNTLVPTPEGDGVILLACKPNEGVFHKLSWNSVGELEWTTMQQTMKHPRHWTSAMYIPDELTNCFTGILLIVECVFKIIGSGPGHLLIHFRKLKIA